MSKFQQSRSSNPQRGWLCHCYTFSPQKTFSQKKFENGVASVANKMAWHFIFLFQLQNLRKISYG